MAVYPMNQQKWPNNHRRRDLTVGATLTHSDRGANMALTMKAATFVLLLAVCGVVTHAQTSTTPSGNITIKMSGGSPEYCLDLQTLGSRGPNDITLRLPLKLRYENHRSETILLPDSASNIVRMNVAGENGTTIVRNRQGGSMDAKRVMAMSRPDTPPSPFSIIAGGKAESSTGPDLLQCLSDADRCISTSVAIAVLNRSSGLDLRGKTVEIVMTVDYRSLTPEVVEKLNEKWKDYGTVWARVVESNTLTFHIPQEPLTRNCTSKPLPR